MFSKKINRWLCVTGSWFWTKLQTILAIAVFLLITIHRVESGVVSFSYVVGGTDAQYFAMGPNSVVASVAKPFSMSLSLHSLSLRSTFRHFEDVVSQFFFNVLQKAVVRHFIGASSPSKCRACAFAI